MIVGENGVGVPAEASAPVPSERVDPESLGADESEIVAEPTVQAVAEPAPEPTLQPEPVVTEVTSETATEPVDSLTSALTNGTTPAPLIATGTGGGCPDLDGLWANGFEVGVFLRDTTELGAITLETVSSPAVIAIETMPQESAWSTLSAELSTTDALATISPTSVKTGFRLTILTFDSPAEEELTALVNNLRMLPSVFAITDNRCTDNAAAQLISS